MHDQDLVFTANIGIVLEHIQDGTSLVCPIHVGTTRCETEIGDRFFRAMGYKTVVAPYKFEGEAR